jgi:transcriptional regulator with XRE-family HTH domain
MLAPEKEVPMAEELEVGGRTVAAERARRGLTQEELAGQLGIGRMRLSDIENGKAKTILSTEMAAFQRVLLIGLDVWFPAPPESAGGGA